MADHCRSLHTLHSSNPLCYECTHSVHGPYQGDLQHLAGVSSGKHGHSRNRNLLQPFHKWHSNISPASEWGYSYMNVMLILCFSMLSFLIKKRITEDVSVILFQLLTVIRLALISRLLSSNWSPSVWSFVKFTRKFVIFKRFWTSSLYGFSISIFGAKTRKITC